MKCMNPVPIYWDKINEKYSYSRPREIDWDKCIVVQCGKCPACRKEWRTQLARRVKYELDKYTSDEVCFITLTCDEEHMQEVFPDNSLNHAYFQKFMKRLRKYLIQNKIPHKPLKYLVAGEYGKHNTHRPHFHMILFGWCPTDLRMKGSKSKRGYTTYESDIILKKWRAGWIDVGTVDEYTAPYMVKYIVKHSEERKRKKVLEDFEFDFIDEDTGEIKEFKGKIEVTKNCFKNPTPLKNKKGEFIKDKRGNYVCEDREVRAPYIVYPKKIIGIDYFLDNYKQILKNGFIFDSLGHKHSIPKSFLKYCDKQDENDLLYKCYLDYRERIKLLFEKEKEYLISLGYVTFADRVIYYREQGEILRKQYESFKDKYR